MNADEVQADQTGEGLTLAEQEKKDGGCTDCGAKLWGEHSPDCPRFKPENAYRCHRCKKTYLTPKAASECPCPKRVTGDNPISEENPWDRAERAEAALLAVRAELTSCLSENEELWNTNSLADKVIDSTIWQLFCVGFVAASIFWMIVYFVVLR